MLFAKGWATGCIHPGDNLDGVKLLVIPHWTIFRKEWVANLEQFVERGGLLVIGARTATKDEHNNVVAETLPGLLRGLVGATVEEYGRQNAPEQRPLNLDIDRQTVHTKWWYEQLRPDADTQVLSHWNSRHLAGSAGITLHPVGKGAVVYVGTYLTQDIMMSLLDLLASRLAIQPVWPNLPDGVNAVLRWNGERKLWFLINFNDCPATIPDAPEGLDLLSNQPVKGALQLAAYGVAVVQN